MAKRVETLYVDDLDGSAADKTVSFTLDGQQLEIDLSAKNADAFYTMMAPYVEAARQVNVVKPGRKPSRLTVTKSAKPAKTSNGNSPLTPQLRAEIRAWAQAHPDLAGASVGDRGRIADSVVANYRKHN